MKRTIARYRGAHHASRATHHICVLTADLCERHGNSICSQATYAPCLLHTEPDMKQLCWLVFEEREAFQSFEDSQSLFLGCCSRAQQSCVQTGACLVRIMANADSLSSWETPLWYTSGCSPASVRMPATLFAAATSPAKTRVRPSPLPSAPPSSTAFCARGHTLNGPRSCHNATTMLHCWGWSISLEALQ